MTPKQQFMGQFLRNVYRFDRIEFDGTYGGSMQVIGFYKVKHPLAGETEIRVPVAIWMDRSKKGNVWYVKFKTYGSHIPTALKDEYIQRAIMHWPGAAKVEVYGRYSGYVSHKAGGLPTLRITTSIRPWAKKKTWREIFKEWLKNHDALKAFKKNLGKRTFEEYTGICVSPYYVLSGAFVWIKTTEGDSYWRTLHNEWMGYCAQQHFV